MSHIHPLAVGNSREETTTGRVSPSPSPDPAFSRIMDEAMNAGDLPDPPLLPARESYITHSLLNGQYPPPDSGAGFTFTAVSLLDEQAA